MRSSALHRIWPTLYASRLNAGPNLVSSWSTNSSLRATLRVLLRHRHKVNFVRVRDATVLWVLLRQCELGQATSFGRAQLRLAFGQGGDARWPFARHPASEMAVCQAKGRRPSDFGQVPNLAEVAWAAAA